MPADEDIRKAMVERARTLNNDEKETDTLKGVHEPKAGAAAMMALFQLFEKYDVEEVEIDLTQERMVKTFDIAMALTPTSVIIKRVPVQTH